MASTAAVSIVWPLDIPMASGKAPIAAWTVASTMYDMSRVTANGYFDSIDKDSRYKKRIELNKQRTEDYKNGSYALAGGLPDKLPDSAPYYVKDYFDYYKTSRGYIPDSPEAIILESMLKGFEQANGHNRLKKINSEFKAAISM